MIAKSYRWQFTAVATAVLMGMGATNALALSLGRVTVQSALGEPLKAAVEILDINADEAATLSTKVAPPEAFKAAGLEYNSAIAGLRATVQRLPDGRAYISLSSDRAVAEPFVDVILEASWNTGRIVRDYTMLFDPPSLRSSSSSVVTPAQSPLVSNATAQKPAVLGRPPANASTGTVPTSRAKPEASKASNDTNEPTVTVKAGDTAGGIAASHLQTGVSLDQMLVAMLRNSPDAFIAGNVNRIKAGALVAIPTQVQASETPATEAKQIILAQSQDFNDFRRNLASSVPAAKVASSAREASGKLQAKVDDKKAAASAPDKLTLSKGGVASKSSESQLAQARNVKEAASRAAEVAKNLKELSQIAAASSSVSAASATSTVKPSSAPTLPVSVAAPIAAPVASTSVSAPAAVVSAPAKPASKVVAPAPAPIAEPGFIDNLLQDPLVPAGALGLIALLAGFGFYKARQRKLAASQDSVFADSKLQPDSFFGSSGGKNINTTDSGVTGSSMIYSPSQLDAVDDVDPVAEADVYLAYGRDLQAEEILKDALRTKPERLAIHHKLLEIYAKRRDAKAYEAIATLAFNLTNGIGQEWEQVCEKGLTLDPNNALYLPGGQPQFDPAGMTVPASIESAASDADAGSPGNTPESGSAGGKGLDLDLDLDFSLDEPDLPDGLLDAPDQVAAVPDTSPLPEIQEAPKEEAWSEPEPMELMALEAAIKQSAPVVTAPELPPEPDFAPTTDAPKLETSNDQGIEFDKTLVLSAPKSAEPPVRNSGMMAFDIGDLSLDFAQTSTSQLAQPAAPPQTQAPESMEEPETQPGAFPEVTGDPLETKLALAEEFKAIGDDDGARALIEEVIAEASGDMKVKAQQALNKL